ncbi:MAG: LysR family transcriptional regulator [Proteobacteria bacterium]|nr:LysR family transcriptional regulator [Pseudomonadota bacterium]
MNVSIKQLQAFVAVAGCQSFAEACTLVHLSQPALSISIKNLEEAVGGKLLARSTRSVALTPEGAEFLPVVQRLLEDWDRSLDDVHNLFVLKRGKLDIAAMPTYASSLLPEILVEFHRLYTDINVTIHDVIAESVVDMVRDGRVELGISFDPGDAQDLNFQPLFLDKFVAVLPPQHELLKKQKLKWNDLQSATYIALQRPSSIRLLLDKTLLDHGIELTPAFEAHQLASIGRMVATGLGVSVVPALSRGQMEEMGALCRPIGSPLITRNVGLITRKRYPLSVATQAMVDVISAWVSPGKQEN